MLDMLEDFVDALTPAMMRITHSDSPMPGLEVGDLYCPKCQGPRRIWIECLSNAHGLTMHLWSEYQLVKANKPPSSRSYIELEPGLFKLRCVQCKLTSTAFLFVFNLVPILSIFPTMVGGGATPHTHSNVRFYLNEAYKCQVSGAFSAAVVMYRSALEQLLLIEGFDNYHLSKKIAALEVAKEKNEGPDWLRDVAPEMLQAMKDLGDDAVHTNTDDVSELKVLDAALCQEIQLVFSDLLEYVYERPLKKKASIEKFKQAHQSIVDKQNQKPT